MRLLILLLLSFPAFAGITVSGGITERDSENRKTEVFETSLERDGWQVAGGYVGDQGITGDFWYLSGQRMAQKDFGLLAPFFAFGVSVRTWMEGNDESLSSPVNFSVSLGTDVGPVRIQWRHMSSGGLLSPNQGQNMLLVGWKFGKE